jgi:adenine-specific DNA-methyltransferase
MNKQDLVSKIKKLDGVSQDERAYLINLVNTKKKYGLVWEDKPEDAEEQLRDNLPVFKEVKEKAILSSSQNTETEITTSTSSNKNSGSLKLDLGSDSIGWTIKKEAPNHTLIEGDNLHALTALTFTHEGEIDVIYIDPPYNTGNKDFKYNDTFVDKEDSYRHSKWLSFMDKRLRIAKRLLSDTGVIFISIDDNEIAQIKLLCDEVFSEFLFVANLLWKKKSTSTNVEGVQVSSLTDYTLCYRKTTQGRIKSKVKLSETRNYPFTDKTGNYRKTIIEKKNAGAYKRETMLFEILGQKPRDGKRWQLGEVKARELEERGRFINEDGTIKLKIYDFEDKDTTSAHPNILDNHGSSDASSRLVNNDILGFPEKFNNPKPIELVSYLVEYTSNKNSYILDFFAGSGTTLHATMQLNAEDGGNRQCILVTNNENNICEEVTYERNKRVIQGYTNAKGVAVAGLENNNLRYYKSEFVPSSKTEQNKRLLTQTSTELLCIKEDCYTDLTESEGFNPSLCKIFTNGNSKYLVVVFHSRQINTVCAELVQFIKGLNTVEKVKLYAFSPEKETLLEDFYEVKDKIDAVPLPEAIYNAYRATFRTLKLDKKPMTVATPTDEIDEEIVLFENQDVE